MSRETTEPTTKNSVPTHAQLYERMGEVNGKMDTLMTYMVTNDRRHIALDRRVDSLEASRDRLRGGIAAALTAGPVIGAAVWEWLRKKFGF